MRHLRANGSVLKSTFIHFRPKADFKGEMGPTMRIAKPARYGPLCLFHEDGNRRNKQPKGIDPRIACSQMHGRCESHYV